VRKLLVSAATALTLAALCACSSTTNKGTITGTLTIAGGPAPGTSQPVAGRVEITYGGPDQYAPDSVTTSDPIAVVQVGDDGNFTTEIQPGRYRVTGFSPAFGDSTYPCTGPSFVQVTPSTSVAADVVCEMK
jgi:hypothetical protein